MSKEEFWVDIPSYEGLYQVSNLGRIKSLRQNKIMKLGTRNTYSTIILRKNNHRKSFQVHRLVAQSFIPNPLNKPIINHKDFNRKNNKWTNLEWCTQKENVMWSICNMKHRKTTTHSNTGEKYITYRKKTNIYRLIINKKEYLCKTLENAIRKRDEILNEKI